MAWTKSNISNSAIRIFLQKVGRFYDQHRGYDPFVPATLQKRELLDYFHHQCCYCGEAINERTHSKDHLIPMNKTYLGLHAWGNVTPCCRDCNNGKQQTPWLDFLSRKAEKKDLGGRKRLIERFVKDYKYDPSLDLHSFADNLYSDVGEVAMTLINLRFHQAEEKIKQLTKAESK